MKKKNTEAAKPEQENIAENDEMQELDVNDMFQFSGAGNPFAKASRVTLQEYTDDMRGRV